MLKGTRENLIFENVKGKVKWFVFQRKRGWEKGWGKRINYVILLSRLLNKFLLPTGLGISREQVSFLNMHYHGLWLRERVSSFNWFFLFFMFNFNGNWDLSKLYLKKLHQRLDASLMLLRIGLDHEPKFVATIHFILNEYSYSITWNQKLSNRKAEKSVASHALKVLQNLGVIKVINVNSQC